MNITWFKIGSLSKEKEGEKLMNILELIEWLNTEIEQNMKLIQSKKCLKNGEIAIGYRVKTEKEVLDKIQGLKGVYNMNMTLEQYFYFEWLIVEKKMSLEKYSSLNDKEIRDLINEYGTFVKQQKP
jgi:hypothetical protein